MLPEPVSGGTSKAIVQAKNILQRFQQAGHQKLPSAGPSACNTTLPRTWYPIA